MSAPSSLIVADTYGHSTACPANGMLTMQNAVIVPVCASGTSSSVGTPHVGHDPRGGTYTFLHFGQRWPT